MKQKLFKLLGFQEKFLRMERECVLVALVIWWLKNTRTVGRLRILWKPYHIFFIYAWVIFIQNMSAQICHLWTFSIFRKQPELDKIANFPRLKRPSMAIQFRSQHLWTTSASPSFFHAEPSVAWFWMTGAKYTTISGPEKGANALGHVPDRVVHERRRWISTVKLHYSIHINMYSTVSELNIYPSIWKNATTDLHSITQRLRLR